MNKKKSHTCIAIIKDKTGSLLMAGDRKVSADWSFSYKCPFPKIRHCWNGMLVGASGDSGLCKQIVDIFEPPSKIEAEDLDIYMNYSYIPALFKHLKNLPGYTDEHKILRLAKDESCSVLIGIEDRAFIVEIGNPEEDIKEMVLSRIILDDVPLPFVIGCGAATAFPILLAECNSKGYNTKLTLTKAMQIAAEISPGADNNIDYRPEEE